MLEAQKERVASFIHTSRVAMTLADPSLADTPIISANAAFEDLTGYPASEVIGKNCRFLQGPLTEPTKVHEIRHAIGAQRRVVTALLNYRRDGSPFNNLLMIDGLKLKNGTRLLVGCQFRFEARIEGQEVFSAAVIRAGEMARLQNRFGGSDAKIMEAFQLRGDAAMVSVRNYLLKDNDRVAF